MTCGRQVDVDTSSRLVLSHAAAAATATAGARNTGSGASGWSCCGEWQ